MVKARYLRVLIMEGKSLSYDFSFLPAKDRDAYGKASQVKCILYGREAIHERNEKAEI